MNHEQRRAYQKMVKKDKMANVCPKCGKLARHVSIARADFSGKCDIYCELCQEKVAEGIDCKPQIYVHLVKEKKETKEEK